MSFCSVVVVVGMVNIVDALMTYVLILDVNVDYETHSYVNLF